MMTTIGTIRREDAAIRKCMAAVSEAATPFESRWTWGGLHRVDPDVHRRLIEQRNLLNKAMVTGTAAEIEMHGAAMCRGYAKAVQVLVQAAAPDDAYMLGQDPRSGFRVAIGEQQAAAERVRELHGQTVIWITPDEVATIVANLEAFKPIVAIKRMFPGAEILDVRPGDPTKGDGDVGEPSGQQQ
jgi:hypothetical protein